LEYLSDGLVLASTVQEITERQHSKPMFVVEGATRFDLYQGKIGKIITLSTHECMWTHLGHIFAQKDSEEVIFIYARDDV